MSLRFLVVALLSVLAGCLAGGGAHVVIVADSPAPRRFTVERVTTVTPFPRGLARVGDKLYVLSRGRVRGAGGVTAAIEDRAGTIYEVDPAIAEALTDASISDAVRHNGRFYATATSPPFKLWDRRSNPPESDRLTDRPYCTLRYDECTKNFYLCAFSGVDKQRTPQDHVAFSKNLTDAILRYDLRTQRWYEVERHDIAAGGTYPHHDPYAQAPPHGWLNGPDNCLVLGNWLYAVSKDNSLLVRYDLHEIARNPDAGPPPSAVALDDAVYVKGLGLRHYYGQSALAYHDGWLYVAYRTSSVVLRIRLHDQFLPVEPIEAELVALFQSYDPVTGKSANLTDMDIDADGMLYVLSAKPARVYRFRPDPDHVFDARNPDTAAWLDLARATANPNMKSENILLAGRGRLFVTSGDGYDFQNGAAGTVYRGSWAQDQ